MIREVEGHPAHPAARRTPVPVGMRVGVPSPAVHPLIPWQGRGAGSRLGCRPPCAPDLHVGRGAGRPGCAASCSVTAGGGHLAAAWERCLASCNRPTPAPRAYRSPSHGFDRAPWPDGTGQDRRRPAQDRRAVFVGIRNACLRCSQPSFLRTAPLQIPAPAGPSGVSSSTRAGRRPPRSGRRWGCPGRPPSCRGCVEVLVLAVARTNAQAPPAQITVALGRGRRAFTA